MPCLGKKLQLWNKKLSSFVNGEQGNTPSENYVKPLLFRDQLPINLLAGSKIKASSGEVQIGIPRDREANTDPVIIPKQERMSQKEMSYLFAVITLKGYRKMSHLFSPNHKTNYRWFTK
jgi:hypothetical protein